MTTQQNSDTQIRTPGKTLSERDLNAAACITYSFEGFPGDTLRPIRFDSDLLLAWEVSRGADVVGFWIGPSRDLGRDCASSLAPQDRTGTWEVVPVQGQHPGILESKGKDPGFRLLVDGVAYEGEMKGLDWILVRA